MKIIPKIFKKYKLEVVSVLIVLFVYFYVHTLFMVQGYTSQSYELIRNIIQITLMLGLTAYALVFVFKEKAKHFWWYLLLASIFFTIAVSHALKTFFGGIIC
jgi:hypothetical protein